MISNYKKHYWKTWEISFLRLAYPLFKVKDIADVLMRRETTIRQYVRMHKLATKVKIKPGYVCEKLTVLSLDKTDKRGNHWECKCECGNLTVVEASRLSRHTVSSCGCKLEDFRKSRFCGEVTGTFFGICQRNAKLRNIIFKITKEDIEFIWKKQKGLCALTGIPLEFGRKRYEGYRSTASIDRIDSKRGYELENIQIVHKTVNIMKMSLSQEEFIEWCTLVAKHAKRNKYNITSSVIKRRTA
jgi:hypothetical protein